MTKQERAKLEAFLTKCRKEAKRLRSELDRTPLDNPQMRAALAIAGTIREEAIKEIEGILALGKGGKHKPEPN